MIEAVNLVKTFDKTRALDEFNCNIADGSVYGLVGSNGSGKSTFLRVVSGVYKPDGGNIIVENMETFNNPAIKAKISYLPDTPYFFNQSDLKEMREFYKKVYPTFDSERFERLLKVFPLDVNQKISRMSKGMQRQGALMLSLSTRPKYLLLDEAFDGLDPVMRQVLKGLLSEGALDDGLSVVISSHNLRELEDLCDHIGLIHKGKLISQGSTDSLKNRIHKVQVAFERTPDLSVFDDLEVLKLTRTGSVVTLVARGEESEILSFIGRLCPLFAESVPITLEELFIYEMGVCGYDTSSLLG